MSVNQHVPPDTRRSGAFRCAHCHAEVSHDAAGTAHRNHCPSCLWSLHVDDQPGDRAAECGSPMEPIAISVRGSGEWILIHRCSRCDILRANRTAADDDPLLLLRVAVGPLAQPPFPIELMASMRGFER